MEALRSVLLNGATQADQSFLDKIVLIRPNDPQGSSSPLDNWTITPYQDVGRFALTSAGHLDQILVSQVRRVKQR